MVFFAAIAAGHFAGKLGLEVSAPMMEFAKNFGLVVFVYTLGLQCGPGFFSSLRKGGLRLTLVAYPFSVLSVILCVMVLHRLFPASASRSSGRASDIYTSVTEVQLRNHELDGRSVADIVQSSGLHFVISRVWRGGTVQIPMSDTVLHDGDHLLLICEKDDIHKLGLYFGFEESEDWNRPNIDWDVIDSNLISRHLRVTRDEVVGQSLGRLKLRNKFAVNITRINRAANLMLRRLGITFFFASLGFSVGGDFVETVFCAQGLKWALLAVVLAALPLLVTGFISEKFLGLTFA